MEAVLVTADNTEDILKWSEGRIRSLHHGAALEPYLIISTPNGMAYAGRGDYIVRNSSGHYSAVKAANFTATFEPVVEVGHD